MNLFLPWDTNLSRMPSGRPILVKQKGEPVPFMAVHKQPDPVGTVQMIEGTDPRGSGFYFSAQQLEGYLDVIGDDKAIIY